MARAKNYGGEAPTAEKDVPSVPTAPAESGGETPSEQNVQSTEAKPEFPAAHPSIDRGPRGWLCRELGLKDPSNEEIFRTAAYLIMLLKKERSKL